MKLPRIHTVTDQEVMARIEDKSQRVHSQALWRALRRDSFDFGKALTWADTRRNEFRRRVFAQSV